MLPPQERLSAHQRPGREVHDWLIVDGELLTFERVAQLRCGGLPSLGLGSQLLGEDLDAAPAARFG